MTDPILSVIIPAYNEEQRISPTLEEVRRWLSARLKHFEVIVVDDGSTDATARVVRRFGDVRLIASRPNRGKGHVVKVGMLEARGEMRLFIDADGSISITQLPALIAEIRRGADIAIGSRRVRGAMTRRAHKPPLYRRIWSWIANHVVQSGLLPGIRDTQCGFKLFTRRAAEAVFPLVATPGWGFDLEVLALARRHGLEIAEVPISWSDDRRTKISPLRDAWRITREFLNIRRRILRGGRGLPMLPACTTRPSS